MTAKRLPSDEGGASTVEFALAVPMLLILLVGVMQLGILLHANGGLRELIGEVGRQAMIDYQNGGGTEDEDVEQDNDFQAWIEDEAESRAYGLDPSHLTANVVSERYEDRGFRRVTITLAYSLTLPLPLLPSLTVNLNQSRAYFAPV